MNNSNDAFYNLHVGYGALVSVINAIDEIKELENLVLKNATMMIDFEYHALNCVGSYDITDIIRNNDCEKLYSIARRYTVENGKVDIIVYWE